MKTTACWSDVIENKDGRGRADYDLRPEVRVELSPQLSAILGLHQTHVTWSKLSKSAVSDKRWLPALSRIIFEFMQRNVTCANGRSILQMFRSDANTRLYRPYVHQVDRGADGSCCFHVHFMEESCLDYQTLSPQLGMLFTGMTMGVRFRHELLNQYRGRLDDLVLTRESCRAVIKEIWHTIEQIEQEGNARGIYDPSRFPIAFGQYRDEVRGMFDRWYRTREQLVQVCSDCECCEQDTRDQRGRCDRLNTMDRLLDELWDMNRRFLFLASARIHEVVARRFNPTRLQPQEAGGACPSSPHAPRTAGLPSASCRHHQAVLSFAKTDLTTRKSCAIVIDQISRKYLCTYRTSGQR